MTDAARWQRVSALFDEAADLPPADRPAFLDAACRAPDGRPDAALREEVEHLLALDADDPRDGVGDRLAFVADGVADDVPPARVGPWRLVREVGRGGMGTVFLAERDDGRFEQRTAVKLVRPGLAPGLVARFRAERQILARLDHPAIARLLDGGQADDGRPYLVMEFVDGEPITAYCDRRRLGVNERLALFQSVCEAVHFAHRQLVVHRDLKPSNVLVAEAADGEARVKLLDFGIAKLLGDGGAGGDGHAAVETAAEQRVMTPEYAAPEQVRGEAVSTATDVYALGVLLYELLTGRRPHAAGGRHAVERAILDTEPARPSEAVTASLPTGGRVPLDPSRAGARETGATGDTGSLRATTAERLRRRLRGDLDRIVLKALRKEPERRYDGAAALGADVRRHLAGLPVEARPDTPAYRIGKFARRHRSAVAGVVVALVAVVGGAGAALWQAAAARAAAARAETAAATSDEVAALLAGILREADPARTRGAAVTVREALDRGAERVRADLTDQPAVRARLLEVIGTTYAQIGLPAEGLPLVREALGLRLAAQADPAADPALADPDALAVTRHQTAGLMLMLGDADGAEPILRAAVAYWRAQPVGTAPDAYRGLNNLGAIFLQRGDLDGARRVLGESIRHARATDGAAPMLPTLLHNLGKLNLDAGRYALADSLFREAVAQGTAALGADAPQVLVSRAGVVETQTLLGHLDEAERRCRALDDELRERYPEQTARRSASATGLGNIALARERFGEAEAHYSEALRLHLVELPRTHRAWAALQSERAYIRLRTGHPAEALALAREATAATDPAALTALERARMQAILGAALVATGARDEGVRALRAARPAVARLGPHDAAFLRFLDRQVRASPA